MERKLNQNVVKKKFKIPVRNIRNNSESDMLEIEAETLASALMQIPDGWAYSLKDSDSYERTDT